MGHSVAAEFFKRKREWSKYKDYLLESYLARYIPKVIHLGRPVVIVDCFAGQGRFDDGSEGSPLLIAKVVRKWSQSGKQVRARFFEKDPEVVGKLKAAVSEYRDCSSVTRGSFEALLSEVAELAKTSTLFLYVDPYTVKGLSFTAMSKVFEHIQKSNASVEVLMNFNTSMFMRWALSALVIDNAVMANVIDDLGDDPDANLQLSELDDIAGGDYWRPVASDLETSFPEKLRRFLSGYRGRLTTHFRHVCSCEIKEKYHHSVPKYVMVFATRSEKAISLMNNSMCEALRAFLTAEFTKQRLFSVVPEWEEIDEKRLKDELLKAFVPPDQKLTRPELRLAMMRCGLFGRVTDTDVNDAITALVKEGRIRSTSGKTRVNDNVELWLMPPAKQQRSLFQD